VHADHVPVGRREARCAGHHQGRGVQARPATARLTQPEAVGEGVSLGRPLALVTTGEVEHLEVVVGQRQHHFQPVDDVLVRRRVGDRAPATEPTPGHRLHLVAELEPGVAVLGAEQVAARLQGLADRPEPRAPRTAARPVAPQVRTRVPAPRVLAEQRHPRPRSGRLRTSQPPDQRQRAVDRAERQDGP
jgi:hypothetical protein